MTDLVGRAALVTGGASGIGAAIARALSAAGATVTVADRDEAAAFDLATAIGGVPWVVDLSDGSALENLQLGQDIVVNNAGFQHVSPIEQFDPAVFRGMQAVMVEAPFLLIRAALPHMYANGYGRFINITSIHGLRASAYKCAYVAAKHALEGLSKVAALEGAAHGVTSVCISPGYVHTPLVDAQIASQAAAHGMDADEVVDKVLLARSAFKRLIQPETVADLAVWLCRDDADVATGSSFTLSGGWIAS